MSSYKKIYKRNKKNYKRIKDRSCPTVPQVKGMIMRKLETKFGDANSLGVLNPLNTGIITDLFQIAPGTTQNQRTGAVINPIKMNCRGHFTGLAANTRFRNIHFIWKPDNAVAPTLGQILDNGPSGLPDVDSNFNYNNKKNYKILSDKNYYVANNVAGNQSSKTIGMYNYTIKKKLLKEMSFTTGLNTGEYHIYSLLLTDAAAAANSVGVLEQNRLYYKDA